MTILQPATAEWQPPEGAAREILITGEQLYGRACIYCGSQLPGLMDAGRVSITISSGKTLEWPVKACPRHTAEVAT